MTYVYEYVVGNDNVKVEYCHSSVSDSIKVVEMWVNGKFHRVNWMSDAGRDKLMSALDKDMTDRMCGTGEYSTEIDLDRDVPMMELYNVKQVLIRYQSNRTLMQDLICYVRISTRIMSIGLMVEFHWETSRV